MEDNRDIRKLIASWLMLAVFLIPTVVKSAHICYSNEQDKYNLCSSTHDHSKNNHGNCLICEFAFSSFEKSESVVICSFFSFKKTVKNFFIAEKEKHISLILKSLRAPPFC